MSRHRGTSGAILATLIGIRREAALARRYLQRLLGRPLGRFTTHITAVHVQGMEVVPMPTQPDVMPLATLPSSTVSAEVSVVNPRLADGSAVQSVTWSLLNDNGALTLDPGTEDVVKDPATGEVVTDPTNGQPLKVFKVLARTPLDEGEGTVVIGSAGMADCHQPIKYADPPVGHFATHVNVVPEA